MSNEAGLVTVGAGSRPDCHDMSLWCHVTSHSRRHTHTRAADCGVTGASGLQIPTRHGDYTDNRQGQCGVLCLNTEKYNESSVLRLPMCSGCPAGDLEPVVPRGLGRKHCIVSSSVAGSRWLVSGGLRNAQDHCQY